MNKSITQDAQNDNQISKTIRRFFTRFHISWIQAFQLLLQMFRELLADNLDVADDKVDELVDAFMDTIPALLKSKLQAA